MSYFADLWAALKQDGVDIDKTEAAALGAPAGETVSLYAAIADKHGAFLGHVACALLWLVQARHCYDQLAGIPMGFWNYLRAFVLVFGIPALLIWAAHKYL